MKMLGLYLFPPLNRKYLHTIIPGRGQEIFSPPPRPDRLRGPPLPPPNGHQGPPPRKGVNRSEREADHSPPSSAKAKECVDLHLHSPTRPQVVAVS